MKNVLTLLLIVCFSAFTYAQKVDLDRSYAPVSFKQLPLKPLGLDYKTFSVATKLSTQVGKEVTTQEVADRMTLAGFKKVADSSDVTITLFVDDLSISRTEVKSREEVAKDKNGNVTGRQYYYWFEIDYTITARAVLTDNKAKRTVENMVLDSRDNNHLSKSKEVGSYEAARDIYVLNKEMTLHNLIKGNVESYFQRFNAQFSTNYGFTNAEEKVLLWINGGEKHPEFAPYAQADNSMKQAFAMLTPDAPIDQAKEAFAPGMEYLNGLLQKYTADEKADKKLRYSAYFNLGQIYLFLDMPDEAIKMGDALIINDYDTSDGKRIIKEANALKELFAKNKISSRHFDRAL